MTSEKPLRVVTYNIHAAKRGLDQIIEVLKGFHADVLALQELDRNTRRRGYIDQTRAIARALDMDYIFHNSRQRSGGEFGLATLSPLGFREVEAVQLRRSGMLELPRVCLRAVVPYADHRWHVLNAHLGHTVTGTNKRGREIQAKHITRLLGNDEGTHVVMGDFNSRPTQPFFDAMHETLDDVLALAGKGDAKTWHARNPTMRLDYIFVTRDVDVLHAEVGGAQASDHRPIIADLQLAAARREAPEPGPGPERRWGFRRTPRPPGPQSLPK